jgi:hypothetical protein
MKENYQFPFQEKFEDGFYIRNFDSETNEEEFVWHRDKEDRIIEMHTSN